MPGHIKGHIRKLNLEPPPPPPKRDKRQKAYIAPTFDDSSKRRQDRSKDEGYTGKRESKKELPFTSPTPAQPVAVEPLPKPQDVKDSTAQKEIQEAPQPQETTVVVEEEPPDTKTTTVPNSVPKNENDIIPPNTAEASDQDPTSLSQPAKAKLKKVPTGTKEHTEEYEPDNNAGNKPQRKASKMGGNPIVRKSKHASVHKTEGGAGAEAPVVASNIDDKETVDQPRKRRSTGKKKSKDQIALTPEPEVTSTPDEKPKAKKISKPNEPVEGSEVKGKNEAGVSGGGSGPTKKKTKSEGVTGAEESTKRKSDVPKTDASARNSNGLNGSVPPKPAKKSDAPDPTGVVKPPKKSDTPDPSDPHKPSKISDTPDATGVVKPTRKSDLPNPTGVVKPAKTSGTPDPTDVVKPARKSDDPGATNKVKPVKTSNTPDPTGGVKPRRKSDIPDPSGAVKPAKTADTPDSTGVVKPPRKSDAPTGKVKPAKNSETRGSTSVKKLDTPAGAGPSAINKSDAWDTAKLKRATPAKKPDPPEKKVETPEAVATVKKKSKSSIPENKPTAQLAKAPQPKQDKKPDPAAEAKAPKKSSYKSDPAEIATTDAVPTKRKSKSKLSSDTKNVIKGEAKPDPPPKSILKKSIEEPKRSSKPGSVPESNNSAPTKKRSKSIFRASKDSDRKSSRAELGKKKKSKSSLHRISSNSSIRFRKGGSSDDRKKIPNKDSKPEPKSKKASGDVVDGKNKNNKTMSNNAGGPTVAEKPKNKNE